ncbi:hypothetical protein FRC10_004092 [Ceratobasidium sp. 414]|nr:hypothetical protein FRC10_004092 [Ceratobasidium sp. 414]
MYIPASNWIPPSALDKWEAARTLLAATIQSYRVACTTLRTISALQAHQPPEHALVKELFLTINSELGSLAAEEDTLYVARMSLAAIRNESPTLVRVNALPPEILASIFALSKTYCVHDYKYNFQNFAGVCTYWRRIAMHTTGLWNHVDVGPSTSAHLTKLLLERTKDTPIHLHLFELDSRIYTSFTPGHETLKAVKVLKPHIHRVCNLEMESDSELTDSLFCAVLNL